MKIRNGFVSNSSSSSFILDKRYLSKAQLYHIKEYLNDEEQNYDGWRITKEDEDFLEGFTIMDNNSFCEYLNTLYLLPKAIVSWGD